VTATRVPIFFIPCLRQYSYQLMWVWWVCAWWWFYCGCVEWISADVWLRMHWLDGKNLCLDLWFKIYDIFLLFFNFYKTEVWYATGL